MTKKQQPQLQSNIRRMVYGSICAIMVLISFSVFSVELETLAQIYLVCIGFGMVSMGMIVLTIINPSLAAFWTHAPVERRDVLKVYAVLTLIFLGTAMLIQPASIKNMQQNQIELKQK